MFVVIPERLPVVETEKAVQVLAKYRIPVAAVLVNRVLPAEARGEFLERRREREHVYLDMITDAFARYPLYHIPLFDQDVCGLAALERVIAALPEEERRSA